MLRQAKFLLYFVLISLFPQSVSAEQEIIGTVLGEPVYREQLEGYIGDDLQIELYALFIEPVMEKYIQDNQAETEPSNTEVNQFMAFYLKQHNKELKGKKKGMVIKMQSIMAELNTGTITQTRKEELVGELFYLKSELEPPGVDYAMFVLPHWKRHRHLYKKYGGGRLLWQQRGIEAFDAHLKWMKEQEANGLFSFKDQVLQAKLYHYWQAKDHGPQLISDPKRIKKDFLEPEWLSIKIRDKKGCLYPARPKSVKRCLAYKRLYK